MIINKTYFLVLILLIITNIGFAQVKIGDDVNNLDETSILELESDSKVLVLTRMSNTQMSAINPLPGGMVYNTDTGCIHSYNGSGWVNLCNGNAGTFSFTDNNDGSFTINYANGTTFTSPNLTGPQGETGPQGPAGENGISEQEQIVILASNGQTQFTTPAPIVDERKIEVYRNGVRIAFTTVNTNTIRLENEVTCFQNDNIRIVQIL